MKSDKDGSCYIEINIKLLGSYKAEIIIDDKKFNYGFNLGGHWHFEGIGNKELDTTRGGLIALKLVDVLPDILQGYIPEESNPQDDAYDTWETLSNSAADQVYNALKI